MLIQTRSNTGVYNNRGFSVLAQFLNMEAAEPFCCEISQWAGENTDDEDALLQAAGKEFEETELSIPSGTTTTPMSPAAQSDQQGRSSTLWFPPCRVWNKYNWPEQTAFLTQQERYEIQPKIWEDCSIDRKNNKHTNPTSDNNASIRSIIQACLLCP